MRNVFHENIKRNLYLTEYFNFMKVQIEIYA